MLYLYNVVSDIHSSIKFPSQLKKIRSKAIHLSIFGSFLGDLLDSRQMIIVIKKIVRY